MCGVKWPHPASCHNRLHQEPLWVSAIVLGSLTAIAKSHRHLLLPALDAGGPRPRASMSGSGEGPLLGLDFSVSPHRRRRRELLGVPFIRALIPSEGSTHDQITSQGPLS